MFLHEAGEDDDSFTRQDLSSMNVISTQQPAQSLAPHSVTRPLQPQPPPQQAPNAKAAAVPPLSRQESHDDPPSPTGSGAGPALPSTANWGKQGRRASRSTNASASSPMVTNVVPAPQAEPSKKKGKESVQTDAQIRGGASKPSSPQPPRQQQGLPDLDHVLKAISSSTLR